MDSIDSLQASARRAHATMDAAAARIAESGLPMAPPAADPAVPVAPGDNGVDVAEQITTLMVASQAHRASMAAMRSVLDTYRVVMDLVEGPPPA